MLRRFFRWLFTLAAALSLLLCLAAATMWVRSYIVGDHWSWYTLGEPSWLRGGNLDSGQGRIRYTALRHLDAFPYAHYRRSADPSERMDDPSGPPGPGDRRHGIPGLRVDVLGLPTAAGGIVPVIVVVTVAYPLLLTLTAPLPALWLFRRLRRQPGLCRRCGYDLRASTTTCPECGAPIAAQHRAPIPSRDL